MKTGILYSGIPAEEELAACPGIPSRERAGRGRTAVIECVQCIPCNPCVTACPFHAISMPGGITGLPVLDEDRCTGCGRCVGVCPGLAITLVDAHEKEFGTVDFPYEYYPFPEKGQEVEAVGRDGRTLCAAEVLQVVQPDKEDGTRVVRVRVPSEFVWQVKSIRRLKRAEV